MEQNSAEATQILQSDTKAIDAWLKGLWDRARKAAEVIARLRQERGELQGKVASLEEELVRVKEDLIRSDNAIRSLAAERDAVGPQTFLNGEKELLSAKVKELLAKLDEYT